MLMYTDTGAPFQLDLSDLVCTVTRIKVSRLTFGHAAKMPKVSFDLGADIKEAETSKGRLRLSYTLYLDANPAVERAEISGEATITSPAITAVTDLQAVGEEKISEIAMAIYSRNYELLYLTFQSAGLVAPSPLLIEDVHIVPGQVAEAEAPANPEAVAMVAPVAN